MRPQDQGFDESLIHTSGGIAQPPDADNRLLQSAAAAERRSGSGPRLLHRRVLRCRPGFIAASGSGRSLPTSTNVPHAPLEVDDASVEPFRKLGLDNTTSRIYAMVKNSTTILRRLWRGSMN